MAPFFRVFFGPRSLVAALLGMTWRLRLRVLRRPGGLRPGAGSVILGGEMAGTLAQLNVSNGGMPKLPVTSAMVTRDGVAGDWQKNRKYHGGPDRAVCVYSEELYAWLRGKGIDLASGALGENFTTRGVDLSMLNKGDRLRVGETCVVQITDVRVPCRQLMKWDARLPKLIVGNSGWVARVIREGEVKAGDEIRYDE